MRQILCVLLLAYSAFSQTNAQIYAPATGPTKGSLLVIGGGAVGKEIMDRFAALAGGYDAPIILIPTAGDAETYNPHTAEAVFLAKAGFTNITLLHTRDRALADTVDFAAPLRKARGVWLAGGRQWRLVDSYLNTRTHRELEALLDRGGVIAGSSAGATIQASYMVRGAREGNTVMMAQGYEEGFGFLRPVAVDQHLIVRKRENDMVQVVAAHPELLGIGIDEATAIEVHANVFTVIGPSKVAIYDINTPGPDGKPYYFLSAGDKFDMKSRRLLQPR